MEKSNPCKTEDQLEKGYEARLQKHGLLLCFAFPCPKHTPQITKELEKLIISAASFILGRKSRRGCKMLEQGKTTIEKDYSFQSLPLYYL